MSLVIGGDVKIVEESGTTPPRHPARIELIWCSKEWFQTIKREILTTMLDFK